jgi:hypothetical protein
VGASVTSQGQTEIKNFLEQLITSSIPFPDVFYAMRNYQNKGSGKTLYDFYCDTRNASMPFAYTWDSNGIQGNSSQAVAPYGIATSLGTIFDSTKPSTMVAVAQGPTSTTNLNGVMGYTALSATGSPGMGYNSGSLNIKEEFTSNILTNSSAAYNFMGRSVNGTNVVLNTLGVSNSYSSALLGGGSFGIGNFTRTGGTQSNYTLNGYMPFAAAWITRALDFTTMETLRTKAVPKLGAGVIVGTTNGYLLVGCQADGVGDITCPSTATAVNAGLGGAYPNIMGITASANGRYFYVNNWQGSSSNTNLGQCDRSQSPLTCSSQATVSAYYVWSNNRVDRNVIVVAATSSQTLGYCGVDAAGSITGNCQSPSMGNLMGGVLPFTTTAGVFQWLLGTYNSTLYTCPAPTYNPATSTWTNILSGTGSCTPNTVSSTYSYGMATRTYGANTRLYVGTYTTLDIYKLDPATGLLSGSVVQSVSGAGSPNTLTLGPNAVYLASGSSTLYRCSLDPVTGLVLGTCKQQGNSSGQFTVGGMAYTPTSILFY